MLEVMYIATDYLGVGHNGILLKPNSMTSSPCLPLPLLQEAFHAVEDDLVLLILLSPPFQGPGFQLYSTMPSFALDFLPKAKM